MNSNTSTLPFLGKFSTRNLPKDFEEPVPRVQQDNIPYDAMITLLKANYDGGGNKTLSNYEFNKLAQGAEDSFDNFVITVKREAAHCDFKCVSDTCDVADLLIRDRLIIGTKYREIRKNALKNQWNLDDLVKNGRALEAAKHGALKIKQEHDSLQPSVSQVKKTLKNNSDDSSREKRTRRLAKCDTRIRRMRSKTKEVRKATSAPRYEVEVIFNEQKAKAYADTGADIIVMSKREAKRLDLKLCKTKMRIKPYGSKAVNAEICYIGTIMDGDHVVNACIYVVK